MGSEAVPDENTMCVNRYRVLGASGDLEFEKRRWWRTGRVDAITFPADDLSI